jgi:hypothetical protein
VPKAILDVTLCHEDLGIFLGFGKGMDDSAKCVAKLVECTLWRHLHGGVIDQLNESAIL